MVFSLLTIAAFWLLIVAVPADPQEPGSWLSANSNSVALGLNLLPFAGIAFLWFIGVLRDRLGELEDRFFATVFFGSGLLFLGTLFTAAALVGAILIAFAARPEELINSATFHFARAAAYSILNIYMVKMAGVFMISTSTVAIYSRHRAALARDPRLWAVAASAVRELLHSLELHRLSVVGVHDQRLHPAGQSSRIVRKRSLNRLCGHD